MQYLTSSLKILSFKKKDLRMFLTFKETKQLVIVSKNSQILLFILFVVLPNVYQLKSICINRQSATTEQTSFLFSRIPQVVVSYKLYVYIFPLKEILFRNIKRGLKRRNKSKLEEKRKLFLVHY